MAPNDNYIHGGISILVEPAQPQLLGLGLSSRLRLVITRLVRRHMFEDALVAVTAGSRFLEMSANPVLRIGIVRVGLSSGPEVLAGLLLRVGPLVVTALTRIPYGLTPVFLRFRITISSASTRRSSSSITV